MKGISEKWVVEGRGVNRLDCGYYVVEKETREVVWGPARTRDEAFEFFEEMIRMEEQGRERTRRVLGVVKGIGGGWAVAQRTLQFLPVLHRMGKPGSAFHEWTEVSRKELFSGFDSSEAASEMLLDLLEQEDM